MHLYVLFSVEGESVSKVFSQHCNICKYQVMATLTMLPAACVEIHQLNLSRFKVVP